MKVVAKEIEMIAWFKKVDMPIPIKFKLINSEEKQIIKVDKIIHTNQEKLAGNKMYIYRCQSVISGNEKLYELKYEVDRCKWYLFKI
ncbi:hypothetical protein GC105_05050 [Alkalibaculum sp. M08DMB]|uniref:Uncharacterized protein n=1 Tax=Alkalibaculum sporogenes TaxID=2655001 RepID=A0A6A7K6U6_9FIRM|nr:hypothetical protein [Alkalibaculum sporogenes]MPW25156.1 hypothetical protein [Alkalibaculum sporogenes]